MANTKTKNLVVKFIADTKQHDINVKKSMSLYKGMDRAGGRATSKISTGFKGMGSSAGSSTGMVAGLSTKLAAIAAPLAAAAAGFFFLAKGMKSVISAGMGAEDAIVKMGVLFKSEAKGREMFQKSIEFSTGTSATPTQIVDAAVVAGQYGVDAFAQGQLGLQKTAMDLIADMSAFATKQGAIFTTEQAATALFRGDLALLERFGKQGRDAYKSAKKKGELGSQEFIKAFVKGMEKVSLWNGMALKQSKTMTGLSSTIAGNIGLISIHLSGAAEDTGIVTLWTQLKTIVDEFSTGFTQFIKDARPHLVEFGAIMGELFTAAWDSLKMLWEALKPTIIPIVFLLWQYIKFFISGMTQSLKLLSFIGNTIMWIRKVTMDWLMSIDWILDSIVWVLDRVQDIANFISDTFTWLQMLWQLFSIYAIALIEKFVGFAKKLPGYFVDAFDWIIKKLNIIGRWFSKLLDDAKDLASLGVGFVVDAAKDIGRAATDVYYDVTGKERPKKTEFDFTQESSSPNVRTVGELAERGRQLDAGATYTTTTITNINLEKELAARLQINTPGFGTGAP